MATDVYYSIGTSTADMKNAGGCTITITSGSAELSAAPTVAAVGVGDRIIYNTDVVCYISARISSTVYDVVIDDKKVAGAAQRRKKQGYLHQGSISIALPKEEILKDLFIDENVFLEMKKTSFSFLEEKATILQINEIRQNLEKHLIKSLEKNLLS